MSEFTEGEKPPVPDQEPPAVDSVEGFTEEELERGSQQEE